MGILTDDMKRLVEEQKLAFHATVCPDGSPNLSDDGIDDRSGDAPSQRARFARLHDRRSEPPAPESG